MGALGAVLKAYKRRLGRSLGRLGAVLAPLEAMLEPFGELPRPFWTRPDSSWQHVADLLHFVFFYEFHRFSMFFIDLAAPRNGSEGILELLEAT